MHRRLHRARAFHDFNTQDTEKRMYLSQAQQKTVRLRGKYE